MGCGISSDHLGEPPVRAHHRQEKEIAICSSKVEIPLCAVDSKYHLLEGENLGEGTYGVVRIAQDLKSGKKYALKAVSRCSTDDFKAPSMQDFKQSVQILVGLSHPRVVCLHEYFASVTHTYMVFPIFSGGCVMDGMKRHWNENKDIPIEAARTVVKQMTAGVAYIHDNNIAHRDIKPDNFLMDVFNIDDPHINIGLSDFDFAVRVSPAQVLTCVCGTKHYMAPEMLGESPKYGMKVDVWALGIILNGLIARSFLFQNDTEIQFKKIVVPRRLPSEAEHLFLGTLKRVVKDRTSASAMLEHPWLNFEPLETTNEQELPTILSSPRKMPGKFGQEKPDLWKVQT
jgi:serine/threonine protein kinase